MGQKRFNSLALLHFHKERTDAIDANDFITNEKRARHFEKFTPADLQYNEVRKQRRARENDLSAVAVVAGLTKIKLQTLTTELIKRLCSGLRAFTTLRISWKLAIPSPLCNKILTIGNWAKSSRPYWYHQLFSVEIEVGLLHQHSADCLTEVFPNSRMPGSWVVKSVSWWTIWVNLKLRSTFDGNRPGQ